MWEALFARSRMKTHIVAYREPRRKERDQGVMILCRNARGKVRTFLNSDDARHAAGALGVVETAMTEEELNRENREAIK